MAFEDEKAQSRWASAMRPTWAVPCALTLTAVIYGSWAVVAKVALGQHGVVPLVLAFYRALGGSTLMFMMHRAVEAGKLESFSVSCISPVDAFRFLGLGLLLALNIGGNILAVQSLTSILVAVFQPLLPVIAGLAAALLGVEEISLLKVLGVFCATTGAVVVVIFSPAARHHQTTSAINFAQGIPCLLINVTGGALYTVFQKGVLRSHPPILTAASAFAGAAGFLFVGAVCTGGLNHDAWRLGNSPKALLALLYAIFLVTALNYSVLAWANKLSSPTMVTSFLTLQPICAAVLACIFLHEILTWGQIAGGATIIAGLACFVLSARSAHSPSEAQPLVPAKQQPVPENS